MNRGEFGRQVFERLHVPINGKTLTFFVAWCAFEDTNALNNPCATTEPFGHATDFNSVGVKNYATVADGIDAWLYTITNGFYDHLVKVLQNKASTPREMLNALDASPWGSHPNTALYEAVEKDYQRYNVEVPGSNNHVQPHVEEEPVKEPVVSEEEVVDTKVDTLEDRLAAQNAAAGVVPAPEPEAVEPEGEGDVVESESPAVETGNVDTLEDRLAAQAEAAKEVPLVGEQEEGA